MEELSDILSTRDQDFKEKTFKIFKILDLTIMCVENFLRVEEVMFMDGQFIWEDVTITDGLVSIYGVVTYEPGTKIHIDNDTIDITKENFSDFQRSVRMSLPYDLVVNGTEQTIMDFLEELKTHVDNRHIVEQNQDFDLDKLTPEQKFALILYMNNPGTSN